MKEVYQEPIEKAIVLELTFSDEKTNIHEIRTIEVNTTKEISMRSPEETLPTIPHTNND